MAVDGYDWDGAREATAVEAQSSGARRLPVNANGYERGKAKRRQLILKTAIRIITDEGAEGLTIRAIGARAGLSPVTVYNLFGSKNAVLEAVYEEDYGRLVAYFEKHASEDALVRIFDLVDLSTRYFQKHLKFYKALFGELLSHSNTAIAISNWASRSINVRRLLASAVAAGHLRKDTPVDLIATIFIRVGKSVTQEWVDGTLAADQSRSELKATYRLILESYMTPKGRRLLA